VLSARSRFSLFCITSLHSCSQLDVDIKDVVVKDVLNTAGYMIPDANDVTINVQPPSLGYLRSGLVVLVLYL